MPFFLVEPGIRLHYAIDDFTDPWANAETILMHHGVAGNHRRWYKWVPHLARKHRVIRLDARGHGDSTLPPEDQHWTIERMAADVAALLDHLGLAKVHYVGVSAGGIVGQHFASTYPERVHSLALISTIPGMALSPINMQEWQAKIRQDGFGGLARGQIRDRFNPDRDPAGLIEWALKDWDTSRPSGVIRMMNAVAVDLTDRLEKISAPTLIISAGADDVTPATTHQLMVDRIPNNEAHVLTGYSHNIGETAGDECARMLGDFLERLPRGA